MYFQTIIDRRIKGMVQKSPGHDLNPSLLFPMSVIDPWAVVHIFWEIVPYSDVGLEGFTDFYK